MTEYIDVAAAKAFVEANYQGDPLLRHLYGTLLEKLPKLWLDSICHSLEAIPAEKWNEDFGDVLWWEFPVCEPPYVGSPLDAEWPGYHTHWTSIPIPEVPWEVDDGIY